MIIRRLSQKEINNRLNKIEAAQRSKHLLESLIVCMDDNGYITVEGCNGRFNYMDEALDYIRGLSGYNENKTVLFIDEFSFDIVPDDLYLPDDLLWYYANAATRREFAKAVKTNPQQWLFMYATLLKENAKTAEWLINEYPVLADLLKHCDNANRLYERYTDQKWFTGNKS